MVNLLKIGLSMLYAMNMPFNQMIKQIPKFNTEIIEIVDDGLHALNARRIGKPKKLAKLHEISFSVHAPFADMNIASPIPTIRRFMLKRMEKSIIHAASLKAELLVFHPGLKTGLSHFQPEKDWKTNLESIRWLISKANQNDVKVTIENVPAIFPFIIQNFDSFKRFFEEINEDLDITLDIGHCNINNDTEDFIKTFGGKIVHVHLHDNDGKRDLHLGIGNGTVNWNEVISLLKKVGFNGSVVVESVENVGESLKKAKKFFSSP